jgi:hypothetical protein
MTPRDDQSDKSNRRQATEAMDGLLEEFERLQRSGLSKAKSEDLVSVLKLIKTQVMGTRQSLETFILQVESLRGTLIPEREADDLIRKAKLVMSQLGGD